MDFVIKKPQQDHLTLVNASDFGVSEGSKDNAPFLQAAIDYCNTQKNCVLQLAKGVYHFENEDFITFDALDNFVFDGNGAELIFSKGSYFAIVNSHVIEIKNTVTDFNWDIFRPADLVRVLSVDLPGGFVELEFLEIDRVEPSVEISGFNQYNKESLTPGVRDRKEVWIPKGALLKSEKGSRENILKLWYKENVLTDIKSGDIFLAQHLFQREGCAFLIQDSTHISLTNNTIYGTIGLTHIVRGKSQYLHLDGVKICKRPNSNRSISTEGDGFHVVQSNGYILIENCDFSFMADDGINIHDCHFPVKKRLSNTSVLLRNEGYGDPGDRMDVRNADFSPTGYQLILEKAEPIEDSSETVLYFKNRVPDNIGEGIILINESYKSDHYILRNNYFHENRARGLLLQCGNGLIENNRFYRTQGAAIYFMLESLINLWYEGSGVQNVVVRNNFFDDCNRANWSSVIDMFAIIPDKISKFPIFKDILIEKNHIKDFPSLAVYLSTAGPVRVSENVVESGQSNEYLAVCERCENIRFVGNSFNETSILTVDDDSIRRKINYFMPLYTYGI